MADPLITLTALFNDLAGAVEGSTSNPSTLVLKLAGFGPSFPVISGTSMLARIDQAFQSNNGAFSTPLWANDQISPANTYYCVTVIDGKGRVLLSGIYIFDAHGSATTIDLSSATQIVNPVLTPPAAAEELDSFTLTAGQTVLPLSFMPAASTQIQLFYMGVLQRKGATGTGYWTISGQTITLNFNGSAGDFVDVYYYTSS